jgi:hypothetical protein
MGGSKSRKYLQWSRELYDASKGLPPGKVNCLARIRSRIWAGTESGIYILGKGAWKRKAGKGSPAGRVTFLAEHGNAVLAGSEEGLLMQLNDKWSTPDGPSSGLVADVDAQGRLWLCASDGLWIHDGSNWEHARRTRAGMGFRDFRCLSQGPARAVAATSRGLYFLQGKRFYWFGIRAKEEGLLSNDTRGVRMDDSGQLWVATDRGLSIFSGGNGWCSITGQEKLPYEDVKGLEMTPWGEYWLGTDVGLILLKDGRWKYFASKRWLPNDEVTGILPVAQGDVWVATGEGVSHLEGRYMTLGEKAAVYDRTTRDHHTRMGFVTGRGLATQGDISSGSVGISDNDGLWTGLYIAAEAYRYAVTGDKEAKQYARESLDALLWLEEITGISGFPARAIRGVGDPGFGNGHPEWHPTKDGKWEWKGETSSDEIDGHYFALTLYLDLVARKGEKERIVSYTKRLTDHIIDNDYHLCDLDGKPTTWGVWSPRKLNQDDRWRMQRGLNSLEILSYLKSAHHITGEEKYADAYSALITDHHYAINTVKQRQTVMGQQIWHDDRLAYLSYYPLLLYEEDPHLRQVYLLSLERTWEQIQGQRNSLWNTITSAVSGEPHGMGVATSTLGEFPLDLISWTVKNSHRTDITRDPDNPNLAMVPLSPDERPVHEWAGSQRDLDGGRDGMSAMDGTWYLLPYWMGRYHGLID